MEARSRSENRLRPENNESIPIHYYFSDEFELRL